MNDHDNTSRAQNQPQPSRPNPDLQSLAKLVGTWQVSGADAGTVTFEWADGGYFLLQHVELGEMRGLEVIGHEPTFGGEASPGIKSRYYGFSEGEVLDHTYEMAGDTLTIWSGERGSPAYFEGTFSDDGNTLTGAWHYPGGGGYATVSTRATNH